jgi:hypothetical protein
MNKTRASAVGRDTLKQPIERWWPLGLLAIIPLSTPPAGDRQPVPAARPRGRPVGLFQARRGLSGCRLEKGAMRCQRSARTTATSRRATFGLPRWPPCCTSHPRPWPAGPRRASSPYEDTGWTPPLPRSQAPRTPGSALGGTDGLNLATSSIAEGRQQSAVCRRLGHRSAQISWCLRACGCAPRRLRL